MQMVSVESEKSVFVNFVPGPVVTRFRPDADSKKFFKKFSEIPIKLPFIWRKK